MGMFLSLFYYNVPITLIPPMSILLSFFLFFLLFSLCLSSFLFFMLCSFNQKKPEYFTRDDTNTLFS